MLPEGRELLGGKRGSSNVDDVRGGPRRRANLSRSGRDLVKHPSKEDWGIGKVLSVTVDGIVNVIFRLAGEKSISLKHVQLIKVSGTHTASDTVDESSHTHFSSSAKTLCTNCGQPTQFGERAEAKRVDLGWCDSCFKQSQRTFKDSVTGETHYFDELRTIEGIKHRYYSPK
jgi:transcription elongation factor Elf1